MWHCEDLGQGLCVKCARPLVILMRKDIEFLWGPEQEKAMEDLKQAIVMAPYLWPIDYHCDQMVILAVDSSCIATGFILLQLGADGKQYPSHFGSITWNDQESCYSQAKIEIYSLWHPLQAYQLYIIGIRNLRVEIDASYINGILNNPDIQPGAAMNRWIVGIKLFHFELIHVLGTLHTGPDGLSHQASSPNDPVVDDDMDDWLDSTMGFAIVLMNSTVPWTGQLGLPHHQHDQCPCLGWFTLWDPVCSAYHQARGEYDSLAMDIPRSQESQNTDKWLKFVQAILMDPLAPVDLPEAKLRKLVQYASKFFILDGRLL